MNDPNGLVYYDGEYHLFYQHNPHGDMWGHMSWGHAVSTDMVDWQHLPVALQEEDGVMIFSGCVVVDHSNTSGLGSDEATPLVAVYTGHLPGDQLHEDQRIAYSLDKGRTWTKYENNPVLDNGLSDFRDPKVFWYEPRNMWVMTVALPIQRKIEFYSSTDLRSWDFLSSFGPTGAVGGIWECPDLIELPVDGNPEDTRWVLIVNVNPGGPAGGSAGQYFIGHFDGATFTTNTVDPDNRFDAHWLDHGADFYAAVTWSNLPGTGKEALAIAWMNDWRYARAIPSRPWRGFLTIPRRISLETIDDEVVLMHRPDPSLASLRETHVDLHIGRIDEGSIDLDMLGIDGHAVEIIADFRIESATAVGLYVRVSEDQVTTVGYDVTSEQLFVDRTMSGDSSFHHEFPGTFSAPLQLANGRVRMHVIVDTCSVEVFGGDGRVAITSLIFPDPDSNGLSIFAEGGTARLETINVYTLDKARIA